MQNIYLDCNIASASQYNDCLGTRGKAPSLSSVVEEIWQAKIKGPVSLFCTLTIIGFWGLVVLTIIIGFFDKNPLVSILWECESYNLQCSRNSLSFVKGFYCFCIDVPYSCIMLSFCSMRFFVYCLAFYFELNNHKTDTQNKICKTNCIEETFQHLVSGQL